MTDDEMRVREKEKAAIMRRLSSGVSLEDERHLRIVLKKINKEVQDELRVYKRS